MGRRGRGAPPAAGGGCGWWAQSRGRGERSKSGGLRERGNGWRRPGRRWSGARTTATRPVRREFRRVELSEAPVTPHARELLQLGGLARPPRPTRDRRTGDREGSVDSPSAGALHGAGEWRRRRFVWLHSLARPLRWRGGVCSCAR